MDLDAIDVRVQQLFYCDKATSYTKQKDSLQKELEGFLSALPGYVTLATVTPCDLCRFLVYKDKHGRTQVHRNSCTFMGQRGKHPRGCPMRLSYKTVDSYVRKLRSNFHAYGRIESGTGGSDWATLPLISLSRIISVWSKLNNCRQHLSS